MGLLNKLHTVLHYKGWSHKEIEHAKKILKKAEENKHPHVKKIEKSFFWFILLIFLVKTALLVWFSYPLLFGLGFYVYVIIAFLGFIVGVVFTTATRELSNLMHHHHIIAGALIFITASINFLLMHGKIKTDIAVQHIAPTLIANPYLLGILYSISLLLPYVYHIYHDNYLNRHVHKATT